MVGGGKLRVLRGDHEGLGDKVEVLRPFGVLKPLDVLVQPVFSCQLVRPAGKKMVKIWEKASLSQSHKRVIDDDAFA